MKQYFQCPKEAFIDFAVEFSNEFFPIDAKTVSFKQTQDFTDRFLKKHFMDYDEDATG